MEFKEAFKHAKAGKYVRPNKSSEWATHNNSGCWVDDRNYIHSFDSECYAWDTWEIKPDDIFVWGSCNDDGSSWLYPEDPDKYDYRNSVNIKPDNLFPFDTHQKFKMVLVDD